MNSVPALFWVVSASILGSIFGSFVNMAAYRLPRNISTWKRSRSFCPQCQHQLAWYDNIPIFSYLTLFGRCRYCRAPIGPRYLFTELVTAALFALFAYQFFKLNGGPGGRMPTPLFCLQLFLAVDLVLLSVVDLEVWLIPIETTLWWVIPAFVFALIFPNDLHASLAPWTSSAALNAAVDSFFGLVIGAGVLWSVGFLVAILFWIRNTLRGIKEAPPEAMGMGDVHLLAMAGAWLGWKAALMAILIGVFLGAAVGFAKIGWGKLQRWRLGAKWIPPPPPTFDLPDETGDYTPGLWPLALFGVVILIVCGFLNDRRQYLGNAPEYAAPLVLAATVGVLLLLAFPFYLYLQHAGLTPGGEVVEHDDGKREEVYHGNYIPFGPSLAAGVLIVALLDPLLRSFAFWFFMGSVGSVPAWPWHVAGESWIGPALHSFSNGFNNFTRWLLELFGAHLK